MHCSTTRSRSTLAAAAVAAALALVGCATTQVDAQWRSIDLPANYLRGTTVLVTCETPEVVLQRICEDRVSADLTARGARPVLGGTATASVATPGVPDMQYLPAARSRGAKAVLSVTVGVNSQTVSQGLSIGIGGFGFGRSSGGGVGVSAPIGGGQVSQGYAANGRLTDVPSGRLMWTARASAPPSNDLNQQVTELSRSMLDAAAGAGLF